MGGGEGRKKERKAENWLGGRGGGGVGRFGAVSRGWGNLVVGGFLTTAPLFKTST